MKETRKKVLVIEDDLQISRVYEIQIAKEGYEAFIVHNGDEGIKFLNKKKPDLIILDLMMPKKDGFDVLEHIKLKHPDINIPIFVISNLGQDMDRERALSLGVNVYMVKTNHSIKEIMSKIKEYLDR